MTAHYGIMCLKVIIQNLIMLRTDTGPLQKELIIDHTKYIPILHAIGFIHNVHCWGLGNFFKVLDILEFDKCLANTTDFS